jgi:hypothetical protein
MILSRKIDAFVNLLLLMLFSLREVNRISFADLIHDCIDVISSFFQFLKAQILRVARRQNMRLFVTVLFATSIWFIGYRSIPLCSIGGELDDFYK